jgi:2'-5' RNA ligase
MGGSKSGLSHERRQQLVVVALPSDDDPVRKFSSEKEPHLTLLYLGEPNFSSEEFQHFVEYVQHAASQLTRFGLMVDHRGTLGDKNADVLFFDKQWSTEIDRFRAHLLQDDLINVAYNSADQFPEFTPHLTMGFPETPAKPDDSDYNRFSYVRFDRISVWVEDSVGPTFELKSESSALEVAMSQLDIGQQVVDDYFLHYGVKGMKWGARKAKIEAARAPESKHVKAVRDKVKQTKVSSVSNKDLQDAITRMNLEKQFNQLNPGRLEKGHKVVKAVLSGGATANQVLAFNNSPAGQAVREKLHGA